MEIINREFFPQNAITLGQPVKGTDSKIRTEQVLNITNWDEATCSICLKIKNAKAWTDSWRVIFSMVIS